MSTERGVVAPHFVILSGAKDLAGQLDEILRSLRSLRMTYTGNARHRRMIESHSEFA